MANNYSRISNQVAEQLPAFIRDDHTTFVAFLEAYYQFLEEYEPTLEQGRTMERAKSLPTYRDVDKTLGAFSSLLYNEFLSLFPKNTIADKDLIIKHVKDFYRARGSEKSYRFLMRALFNEEIDQFYYPKRDILRASDGKWYIQKTIRLRDTYRNGEVDNSPQSIVFWQGTKIVGNTSGASAIIDAVDQFYQNDELVTELTLSSISGAFAASENVFTNYGQNTSNSLWSMLFSGAIASLSIVDGGFGYQVGQQAVIENQVGDSGSGAIVEISSVSSGNAQNLAVISGGVGFRIGDPLLFSGGSPSIPANASVLLVDTSERYHPNTYNIHTDILLTEANTPIGNAIYTNLQSANANTTFANGLHAFLFTNVGIISAVVINNPGEGYSSVPDVSAIANTQIRSLGILGKLEITSPGIGYAANDKIYFTNVPGGHGFGAKANITTVAGNGAILNVAFIPTPGWLSGGSGYDNDFLPVCNIATSGGTGGVITPIATLGSNDAYTIETGTIGQIIDMIIVSGGSGYSLSPYINLSMFGSGTANVLATVVQGVFTYPGRYLNDDGFLSSHNFLQDRDYYQNYSYVLKLRKTLDTYKEIVLKAVHPAGMKIFGEYLVEDQVSLASPNNSGHTINTASYSDINVNAISMIANSSINKLTTGLATNANAQGALSIWLMPKTLPTSGNNQIIIQFGGANASQILLENNKANLTNSSTGVYLKIRMVDANGHNCLVMITDANSQPVRENTWIHVAAGWNTANAGASKIRIDNLDSTIVLTNTSNTILYNTAPWSLGNTARGYLGNVSELIFSNSYIDISNGRQMILFANNHLPSENVINIFAGAGKTLLVYFKNGANNRTNLNHGTGGSFSNVTGLIVDAIPTPTSELM